MKEQVIEWIASIFSTLILPPACFESSIGFSEAAESFIEDLADYRLYKACERIQQLKNSAAVESSAAGDKSRKY